MLRDGIKLVDLCYKGAQNTRNGHAKFRSSVRSECGMRYFTRTSLHAYLISFAG